jgi:hypothetical protein
MLYDPKAAAVVRWREEVREPAIVRRDEQRMFATLVEATKFVVEVLHPAVRHSATITTEDGRLRIGEISFFYRCLKPDR